MHYITTDNTQTTPKPTKDKIVVIRVQLLKVCRSLIPKYLLTNQKPLSFTWDNIEAPEAMAITNNALSNSLIPKVSNGAVSPAAVIMATVDEPCKIRTKTAAKKANRKILTPCSAK